MSEKNEKYFVGQTVTGTVTGSNSNAVYLEIEEGEKAVIYADDMLEMPTGKLYVEYTEGAEYTAQVKSIGKDKKNPQVVVLYLSTKLAYEKAQAEAKEQALREKVAAFNAIKEADEIIMAKVVRTTQSGADLTYNGTRLFLSYKHSSLSEEALKQLKGEEIAVIVLYVNEERHFISVSQVAAEKKQKRLAKEAAYGAIEVGQVVEGEVVSILAYGAIVKLGLVSGLLHASEYSHNPNDNFNNCVVIGDEVEAAILKIEVKGEKIALSRKALMDNPWSRVNAQYGDLVDFKVVEINEKGLKVETLGVDGFIPTSDALIELKNASLDSYYAIGDEGKAYITDIKPREWFLKLSVRKYLVEQERKSYEKYLEPAEEVTLTLGEKYKDLLK